MKWAKKNKESIGLELREIGAIIFRGFPGLHGAVAFQEFVEALGISSLPYVGGAAVRYPIYKDIHTTNESPPNQPIPFHHEMAQVPLYPLTLFFHCDVITKGGETPILRSDVLYNRVNETFPEFTKKLEEKVQVAINGRVSYTLALSLRKMIQLHPLGGAGFPLSNQKTWLLLVKPLLNLVFLLITWKTETLKRDLLHCQPSRLCLMFTTGKFGLIQ
jgi:hypothetical protein